MNIYFITTVTVLYQVRAFTVYFIKNCFLIDYLFSSWKFLTSINLISVFLKKKHLNISQTFDAIAHAITTELPLVVPCLQGAFVKLNSFLLSDNLKVFASTNNWCYR